VKDMNLIPEQRREIIREKNTSRKIPMKIPMRKILSFALPCAALTLLASFTLAQSSVPRSRVAQFMAPLGPNSANPPVNRSKTPPPYCKPCLFYGGDLDLNNSQADTFANENIIPGNSPTLARIYSPFTVPKGQTWKVTGLLINSLSYPTAPDPVLTPWEIRKGIPLAGGSGGKLVAHGEAKVKMTATGRSINGTPEFTFVVRWKKPVILRAGKYWENVTPQCTNPNNSQCTAQASPGFLNRTWKPRAASTVTDQQSPGMILSGMRPVLASPGRTFIRCICSGCSQAATPCRLA
jgi:hypothetical protein